MDAQETIKLILGTSEQETLSILRDSYFILRVMARDGEQFMGTCEYSSERINVEINNGIVIKAWIG